jgi:hypothetical protein
VRSERFGTFRFDPSERHFAERFHFDQSSASKGSDSAAIGLQVILSCDRSHFSWASLVCFSASSLRSHFDARVEREAIPGADVDVWRGEPRAANRTK